MAAAREVGLHRQRVTILLLSSIEEAGGPERVAVQRKRLRITRRNLDEFLGLATRQPELRHAQSGLNHTGTGTAVGSRVFRPHGAAIGLERFGILALLEQEPAQSQLNLAQLRRNLSVGGHDDGRRSDDRRTREDANPATHEALPDTPSEPWRVSRNSRTGPPPHRR